MANHTLKAIMGNFESMLVEMPFSKVTVSALVERSEISSNTFYYHFRDIYDLLDAWLAVKAEKYFHVTDGFSDWPEQLKTAMKAMQENARIVYHLFDSLPQEHLERFAFGPLEEQFYEAAKRRTAGAPVSEKFVRSIAGIYSYSFFGFIVRFVWDHMKADVDEAVDTLKVIFVGLTEYMIAQDTGALD